MENLTITLSGKGLEDSQELNIQVSVAANINIKAKTAQREATIWLVSEVGNMLISGMPQLVISKNAVWRIPALLTSSRSGVLGQVGSVDVDAESGELMTSDELREQILSNVQNLTGTPLPAVG
jgi:hypothetical protein